MIITQAQAKEIHRLFPDSADALLASNDVNDILDALDDLYLDLLDEDQEPTDESREVEHLRDHIHWSNTH